MTLIPPIPEHLSPPVMRAIASALHEITETAMSDIANSEPTTFFPLEEPAPVAKGSKALSFVIEKLTQPSTIRGLLMLATSLGLALSPAAQEYILEIGMAVVGLVGVWANK